MLKLFACRQKGCVIVTDVKQDGRLIPYIKEGLIREKLNWQRVFQAKRIFSADKTVLAKRKKVT